MTRTSDRIIGTLRQDGGTGAVRLQDTYDTGIDDLWSALTEPERLARWVAEVDGDLRLGGTFTARFTSLWEGTGRVDVCDAPHRLLVTLSTEGEDDTVVEARLTPDGDRTRLTVEERGLPPRAVQAHGAGWQVHLEDLAAYLGGRERSDWAARWRELAPAYQDQADRLRSI